MSRPSVRERLRQTRRLIDDEGPIAVTARLFDRASQTLAPMKGQRLPVARADMVKAAELAATGWQLPAPLEAAADEPLTIAWNLIPPGEGAGGAASLFRLIGLLEQSGHRCVVYLHDRHGWSLEQHERGIRSLWPALRAEIRDGREGIADAHAIFATSWETAYPVATSPARGARFYLVQDLEPMFYAAGSEALLAEATYRFGFHGITLGPWIARQLRERYGMAAEHFEFGCDVERYRLLDDESRSGVCLYARPSTPRRAFELAAVALDLFAERHPEHEIHLYGETVRHLPFRARNHGLLKEPELNALYNRCVTGLVLSATNISLVPCEMLAAGCLPVVNDAEHNREALENPYVVYANPTPFDLANALCGVVERPAEQLRSEAVAASASVRSTSWENASAVIERVIYEVVERGAKHRDDLREVSRL